AAGNGAPLRPPGFCPAPPGDTARSPAVAPGGPAPCPGRPGAAADRRPNPFRQCPPPPPAPASPAPPSHRSGGAAHSALCPARQTRRCGRPPSRACLAALAPGLSERSQGMTAQQPPRNASGIALSVHGLNKTFGQLQVLRALDLEVPAGQFIAVVGRSGCGKSTLLRLLAGLDQPTSGELLAAGQPLKDNRDTRL